MLQLVHSLRLVDWNRRVCLIDWRKMVVLQLLWLVPSRRLMDRNKRDQWSIYWWKMVVLQMLQLVPSRRLMDWNRRDWCSSYSCCNSYPPTDLWTETEKIDWLKENGSVTDAANSSPPAGSWTETEEIDWLIEGNGRVTVAATRPLPPARGLKQRRLIDWRKMVVLQMLQTHPLPPARGQKQKRLIDWGKMCRLTVAATRPLPPARGLKQKRLIDWREMVVLQLLQLVPSHRLVDWNRRDWLIEGKWSCYSCCNSSPPAGSWSETKYIDWRKMVVS